MLRRVLLALVLVVLALPASAGAALPPTVTLGLVGSQTGAASTYGASQLRGVQLAVDDLDASGTLGFMLALATRDDGLTADGASAAFTDLLGTGVAAVLGPTLSGSALAADPLAQAAHVPVVAISNTADGITEMGDYVFRASLAERDQIPAAVRVAHRRLHFKRPVMIVRSDQPFAVSGAKAFTRALSGASVPLVGRRQYTGVPADFGPLLRGLAARHPDALVIESLSEGPQIMRAARQIAGLRHVAFLGGNALNSHAAIVAAGAAAEGLIVGAAWHPAVPSAASRAFVKHFRARFGSAPDQFAAQGYAGVEVVADALKRAGTADGPALRDALAATRRLTTPLGPFSFGASRNVRGPGVVQIVRDGRFRLLR